MTIVAHVSDLHFGRVEPRLIAALVRTITGVAPSLVAVSGDLTQRARRNEFVAARRFLDALPFPLLVVPGNHDVPLYNLASRWLDPYGGYRRHIQRDLEPMFENAEIVAVGLNSARAFPLHGGGRLNEGQVDRASARLASAGSGAIKVVVTHHPFDLPDTHGDEHLVGRAEMAMRRLADAGADLFLAGHLHVSHAGTTATRYQLGGHSAVIVQAGTMSTRQRGELNTLNVLDLGRERIGIQRYSWSEAADTFDVSWSRAYVRAPNGWRELPGTDPSKPDADHRA